MLRGNLSTRPFYNERIVGAVLAAAAVLVIAFTIFNGWRLWSLSTRRQALAAQIDRSRTEAGRQRAEAAAIQQAVDRAALAKLADAAREANDLIDRRTFSWTTFFALIEKTLPLDVRLVTVAPRVEKGTFVVAMTVVARDLGDVSQFIESLQATGAFYDLVPADQQLRDDGTYAAVIDAKYVPAQAGGGRERPPVITTPAVSPPAQPRAGRPPAAPGGSR
jgi:hypothetical protein